jgi:DNA-directed RNA polymerase specialized sigma24 family protein
MKTHNTTAKPLYLLQTPKTDEEVLAEIADTVCRASRGDRDAIGTIAILSGSILLDEARNVMGSLADEAADVLQDFLLSLLEGRSPFTPAQGRAIPWMCGVVRAIARRRRAEREREWGTDPDP